MENKTAEEIAKSLVKLNIQEPTKIEQYAKEVSEVAIENYTFELANDIHEDQNGLLYHMRRACEDTANFAISPIIEKHEALIAELEVLRQKIAQPVKLKGCHKEFILGYDDCSEEFSSWVSEILNKYKTIS